MVEEGRDHILYRASSNSKKSEKSREGPKHTIRINLPEEEVRPQDIHRIKRRGGTEPGHSQDTFIGSRDLERIELFSTRGLSSM